MGNIKVSQLPESGQLSNEDLFYIGKKDTSSEGYRPRRVTFGEIKESIKGGSGTGIQAFEELWKRSGTPSSGTLTLSGSRTNYTGLVFVFKSDNRYSTIFKTNNEIDLALTSSGTLVLDKLLSGIVPVVGNGKGLGLTDGTISGDLIQQTSIGNAIFGTSLNQNLGTSNAEQANNAIRYKSLGVVTDADKSGLVTDLSQATGIELTAITNTSVTLSDVTTIDSIYGLTLVGAQPASDRTDILNAIYPVGSIFTTIDKTFNPGTAFGGEWEVIGDGRCLFGLSRESSDVGQEINSTLPKLDVTFSSSTANVSITQQMVNGAGTPSNNQNKPAIGAGGGDVQGSFTATGTVSISDGAISATTQRNGSSQSVVCNNENNDVRPPSIGVIFWKRTSLA